MPEDTLTVIPEVKVEGKPLGRHILRGPTFDAHVVEAQGTSLSSVTHIRKCPPYDQGSIGSCTGNASAGALMTTPLWVPGREFTEKTAVLFYAQASRISSPGDSYPPNDVGSTGPSVADALEEDGLVFCYSHAVDLQTSLERMLSGPGIFGVNWYTSFDNPLPTGECPLTPEATIRGGHEVEAYATDIPNKRVWFYQSWGPDWGGMNNGTFWFSFETLDTLFAQDADATFMYGTKTVNPTRTT